MYFEFRARKIKSPLKDTTHTLYPNNLQKYIRLRKNISYKFLNIKSLVIVPG